MREKLILFQTQLLMGSACPVPQERSRNIEVANQVCDSNQVGLCFTDLGGSNQVV